MVANVPAGGVPVCATGKPEPKKRKAYWRHNCEGVRLLECCVHPEVAEIFKERLRVMGAAQLDSGIKDLTLAHHKVAKLFNDREFRPKVRFEVPRICVHGLMPEASAVEDIDHNDVQERLNEMKTVKSKALANMERSGTHEAQSDVQIANFCRKKPNGNIWWDVWYSIKLMEVESLKEVLDTMHDALPTNVSRDSGVGGAGAQKRKPEPEKESRGASAAARKKRLRERLDEELSTIAPDDSASALGGFSKSGNSTVAGSSVRAAFESKMLRAEVQREQSLLTGTIISLMRELNNPSLLPEHRFFIQKQLEYNQAKLEGTQGTGSTPTKPSADAAADAAAVAAADSTATTPAPPNYTPTASQGPLL